MVDVLFVVPANEATLIEESKGTLLLATLLKDKGINVDIYRFYEADASQGFESFVQQSAENILKKEPRIVSFYCRCDCYISNIKIAQILKEKRPDLPVVFGGPQADVSGYDTINQLPFVDYCCAGEGETTVYPLFRALLDGEDVTSVKGLIYRDEKGNVVVNPRPDFFENLDDEPFVDFSFVPKDVMRRAVDKNASIAVEVGRGCPFNCSYCSTSLFWKRKFRTKSTDRIIREMLRMSEKYGFTRFGFSHDLFTANKKFVEEFCQKLNESGLKARWHCSSRADTLDSETIKTMAQAGLEGVYLGIETGSERMQKLIHKNLKIEKTTEIVKELINNKVDVITSFMYGFPEETDEDIEQTLHLVYRFYKLGVKNFQFHLCAILLGTEYFERYKDELVYADKVSDIVTDFGIKENFDFICEHKELFPFYYEYRSELRERFAGLEKTAMLFIYIYDRLMKYCGDRFAHTRMVDLYLKFKDENAERIAQLADSGECMKHETELAENFLKAVCADDAGKLTEMFKFWHDMRACAGKRQTFTDVRVYNVDIDAVRKNKPLDEIKEKPTMVYVRCSEGKISYVVKPM